jgi:hypothetical protein
MSTENAQRIAVPQTTGEAAAIIDGIDKVLNNPTFKMTKEARRDLEIRIVMVEATFPFLEEDSDHCLTVEQQEKAAGFPDAAFANPACGG